MLFRSYGRCTDCDDVNREVHPGKVDVCNGRDDDCNGVPDDGEPCTTCTAVSFEGANYLLCPDKQSWFDGVINCRRQGGGLALAETEAERGFFVEQIQALIDALQMADPDAAAAVPTGWWLDANDGDHEGKWVALDGHVIDMPPWAPGRPNGDSDQNCAVLDLTEGGLWNDEDCTAPQATLCRVP